MATIDTIRQYYSDILQRQAVDPVTGANELADRAGEINSYVSAVDSGALTLAQVRSALINSAEGQDVQDVVRLYQVVFGRVPDKAGLNFQVDKLRGPATEANVAEGLAASQEFSTRFGGNVVNSAFVNAVYQQVLGRTPSAGEVQFYLDSGFSAARIALAFSEAPEFRTNVNTAVTTFLDAAGQGTATYTGSLGGSVNVGTSFTLTANVDAPGAVAPAVNTAGTSANDTYNAVNGSINTLTAADQINGGAGTDTLNLLLDDNASVAALNGVTNVEIFNLRDLANGTTVDFATVVGETQVWNDRGTGGLTANNLATGTTVGVRGDGVSTIGATTFTMASATDAVNILIEGGTKGTGAITRNQSGEAAVTVTSAGAANTVGVIDLDNAGANIKAVTINASTALTASLAAGDFAANSTLTINGAGRVDLTGAALADNITTVNAAGSAGGVNVLLGAGATTVTGGTGADRFAFAGNLGAGDTVVGGAGTDTVAIAGVDLTDAANVAQLTALNTKVSGVEVLEFTGATAATIQGGTGTGAFTNTEITKLLFNTTAADTINAAGSTRTYAFGELNTGNATINLAAGATSVNVSLEAIADTTPAGNTGADVATLAVNLDAGVAAGTTATINLASTGPGTVANTVAAVTAVAGSTINITGAHDLTVSALTNGGTVNASAFTGKLSLTASADNDSITGGSGADTLVGGAGVDTINGGAGNDTITGGAGVDTINVGTGDDTVVFGEAFAAGNANHDVITGFEFGAASADKYDIGFNVANGTTAATAALTLLAPVAVASNGTATANDVIFTFSGAGDKLAAGTTAANAVANAVTALTSGTDFSSANIATGDSLVLVLDDGTNSFVFHYVADGTAATTSAADLELIGIVNGQLAGQVVTGDFI